MRPDGKPHGRLSAAVSIRYEIPDPRRIPGCHGARPPRVPAPTGSTVGSAPAARAARLLAEFAITLGEQGVGPPRLGRNGRGAAHGGHHREGGFSIVGVEEPADPFVQAWHHHVLAAADVRVPGQLERSPPARRSGRVGLDGCLPDPAIVEDRARVEGRYADDVGREPQPGPDDLPYPVGQLGVGAGYVSREAGVSHALPLRPPRPTPTYRARPHPRPAPSDAEPDHGQQRQPSSWPCPTRSTKSRSSTGKNSSPLQTALEQTRGENLELRRELARGGNCHLPTLA